MIKFILVLALILPVFLFVNYTHTVINTVIEANSNIHISTRYKAKIQVFVSLGITIILLVLLIL